MSHPDGRGYVGLLTTPQIARKRHGESGRGNLGGRNLETQIVLAAFVLILDAPQSNRHRWNGFERLTERDLHALVRPPYRGIDRTGLHLRPAYGLATLGIHASGTRRVKHALRTAYLHLVEPDMGCFGIGIRALHKALQCRPRSFRGKVSGSGALLGITYRDKKTQGREEGEGFHMGSFR